MQSGKINPHLTKCLINIRACLAPFEGSLRRWKRKGKFEVIHAYFEGFSYNAVSEESENDPPMFFSN